MILRRDANIPSATPIILTADERMALKALANSRKSEARMRDRAKIVLLAADGLASRAISRAVGCTPGTVSKRRVRYAKDQLARLSETAIAVPNRATGRSTTGASWHCSINHRRWLCELVGAAAGARSWRHPRAVHLALSAGAGLSEAAQWATMTGQSHDYKRNGTTTLFAAFDVGNGEVIGWHYKRRRRIEFLDFMNQVVARHPGKEITCGPG